MNLIFGEVKTYEGRPAVITFNVNKLFDEHFIENGTLFIEQKEV